MVNALWIALIGMAIVFAALGVVLLAMIVLRRVFRPKEETKEK